MKVETGNAAWPQVKVDGEWVDAETNIDPVTKIPMCKDCWDGRHDRTGCKIYACKCHCYKGKNKGLQKPHPPAKDCKEQTAIPDVGGFTV